MVLIFHNIIYLIRLTYDPTEFKNTTYVINAKALIYNLIKIKSTYINVNLISLVCVILVILIYQKEHCPVSRGLPKKKLIF